MKRKKTFQRVVYHVLVSIVGLFMLYPMIWMVMSSFKETNTIFTTAGQLIPGRITFDNYINGWRGFASVHSASFLRIPLSLPSLPQLERCCPHLSLPIALPDVHLKGRKYYLPQWLASMMASGADPDGTAVFMV